MTATDYRPLTNSSINNFNNRSDHRVDVNEPYVPPTYLPQSSPNKNDDQQKRLDEILVEFRKLNLPGKEPTILEEIYSRIKPLFTLPQEPTSTCGKIRVCCKSLCSSPNFLPQKTKETLIDIFKLFNWNEVAEFLKVFIHDPHTSVKNLFAVIPSSDFISTFGQGNWDELSKITEIIVQSSEHFIKKKGQDKAFAELSTGELNPGSLEVLASALSLLSGDQEPTVLFEAMQTLQFYVAILVIPLLLSGALYELTAETGALTRLQWFYATAIGLIGIFFLVKLILTCRRKMPRSLKPLRNYTEEANAGRFDRLTGREDVIAKVFLSWASSNRETRQHPLLVGAAGVGKTSILIEIARRLAFNEVLDSQKETLKNKVVFAGSASVFLPASGGLFALPDDKMERVVKRLEPFKNDVVLALDETDVLLTPQNSSSYGELLKSILDTGARGFPYFIGATTIEGYQKYIADNPPWARRFTVIHIPATTQDQTILILREMVRHYASDMRISDDSLKDTYTLTSQLLSKYSQPEISKRILMGIISKMRSDQSSDPSSIELVKYQIEHENLLSRYLSESDNLAKEKEIRDLIKQNDDKKQKSENASKLTTTEKGALEKVRKDLLTCQILISKLATKIHSPNKNVSSVKLNRLKMELVFLLHIKRPSLSKLEQTLSETLKIPKIDKDFIEKIIAEFVKQEAGVGGTAETLKIVNIEFLAKEFKELQKLILDRLSSKTALGSQDLVRYRKYMTLFEQSQQVEEVKKSKEHNDISESRHQLSVWMGLNNIGNSCWLNSSVQAFRSMSTVMQKFLTIQPNSEDEQRTTALKYLFKVMIDCSSETDIKAALEKTYASLIPAGQSRAHYDPDEHFIKKLMGLKIFQSHALKKAEMDLKDLNCHNEISKLLNAESTLPDSFFTIFERNQIDSKHPFTAPEEIEKMRSIAINEVEAEGKLKEYNQIKAEAHKRLEPKIKLPKYIRNNTKLIISEKIKTSIKNKELTYELKACIIHLPSTESGGNESRGHYISIAKGIDKLWRLYDDKDVKLLQGEAWAEYSPNSYIQCWEKVSD